MMSLPPSLLVLQNLDLLNIIFAFFDYRKKRDLLSASLTSKIFLEPALDALWYEVRDVMQLCCLLPSFNKKTGEFVAVVRDQDLERVLYYTRRIRSKLVIDIKKVNKFPAINPDVLYCFFNRINKVAAFHSLRTLIIIYDRKATYRHQLLFFPISAPNLKEICMHGDSEGLPEISVASFLHTISFESPNVTCLAIHSYNGITWTKTIFDVLPCFRKLERLDIWGFGCEDPLGFLKNCASSMTSLQSLTIQLASFRLTDDFGQPTSAGEPSSLGLITFGLLWYLHLDGSFDDVENMLNILLVPVLVTLEIWFQSKHTNDEFIDIQPRLNGFLATNGRYLKGLNLHSRSLLSIEDYLNSFKVLTQLKSLHFECLGSHIPTLNLVNFFAGNIIWSELTDLYLGDYPNTHGVGDILSIAILPLIAEAFPRLLKLDISIYNPDQSAMKTMVATQVHRSHGLKTLFFVNCLPDEWDYTTSSAVAFASFLDQIFPELEDVTCIKCWEWIDSVQEMLSKNKVNTTLPLNLDNVQPL